MKFLNVGSSVTDDSGNNYILKEIIGQGGFGYVFKAYRELDSSVWAVKTTLPSFGDDSSAFAFKNEINSATQISGDNIIQYKYVHNGDEFPELPPYIIMEYADGGTLCSLLENKKQNKEVFKDDELTNIFKQLAKGMQQINAYLVHRDIKPDNILLCGNTLKISDFGLSKVVEENTRTMSFKGGGTLLYMSPEAWNLAKNTIQMDIYSMGIVFYELATLKYPYSPKPTTYEECKSVHLLNAMTNISDVTAHVSPSLTSLINKMLEKDTRKRFNSWEDIIEILEAQISSTSPIDEIVARTVAKKNIENTISKQREAKLWQKHMEEEEFCKLVSSQFERIIINPIIEYAKKFNQQYAGDDKMSYPSQLNIPSKQTELSWELKVSAVNSVKINFEILLKENFSRIVHKNPLWGSSHPRKESYIPQLKNKNILGWGEVINKSKNGFNILLIDSDGIYGDWIIMNNKNNFSLRSTKERKEPFAFSLKELTIEIDKVQVTHLYSSNFDSFDEN